MQTAIQQRNISSDTNINSISVNVANEIQIDNLEKAFAAACPYLVAQVRRRGITPDVVDDIVQELLVEAWQHLDTLRMPERFDAWLDGICRNMCLRWYKRQFQHNRHVTSLPNAAGEYFFAGNVQTSEDIPDPLIADPVEALHRQDLCTLLNSALGYLPGETRQLIELCYLVELPQREVAQRLGLTINILEARLHRARKRLRHVLNTEMRKEALALGLVLDEESTNSWRPSREWCWYCGRHRLEGTFEPLAGNLITFRMRCPECEDVVNTGGLPRMNSLHSFRPALKRVWQVIYRHASDLERGISFCPMCEERRPVRILHPDELLAGYPYASCTTPLRSALVIDCPTCNIHVETSVDSCLISLPIVEQFMEMHPRRIIEPETLLEYDGQPAICLKLTDFTSAAQLTLLVHARTLRVLALFQT